MLRRLVCNGYYFKYQHGGLYFTQATYNLASILTLESITPGRMVLDLSDVRMPFGLASVV